MSPPPVPKGRPPEHSPDHVTEWLVRRFSFHTKHPVWFSSSIQHWERIGLPSQVSAGLTVKPDSGSSTAGLIRVQYSAACWFSAGKARH